MQGIGLSFIVAPTYICEIAPADLNGIKLMGIMQRGVTSRALGALSDRNKSPLSYIHSGRKNNLKIKFFCWIFLGHQGPRRRDIQVKNFMQGALVCCFRLGVAGMSWDVPDLEKL